MDARSRRIIEFLKEHADLSSTEIHSGMDLGISIATLKRDLSRLVSENMLVQTGKGKGTRYTISPAYSLLYSTDVDTYFEKEIDERVIKDSFNFQLMELIRNVKLFTDEELQLLNDLQNQYLFNISQLSKNTHQKELERLAIDLSWKSSQIEGNTYSLLETERLLKEKETAAGKSKEDAVMLLNHKETLDFIIQEPNYVNLLSIAKIENIHSMLIKELGVDRNVRKRKVGISGTNYMPLDNEFQIREALDIMCDIVNTRENIFEKALLILVLTSYIQAFSDGNKRTARILSNATLIGFQYCPISFRTVDSIDYKKAMLIFYEQNNISAFKSIFIDQFRFAVNTYF